MQKVFFYTNLFLPEIFDFFCTKSTEMYKSLQKEFQKTVTIYIFF